MKYLVAFGCSHTNGSMLDGAAGSSYENTRNAFPGILARRYNYELRNISKPGGSNEYIHRSIVEYITHYMDAKLEHLFIINWTSRSRLEFRYPEDSPHEHNTTGDFNDKKAVPFTVGSNAKLFKDPRYKQLQNLAPYYINPELESLNWATWAYAVQQMLDKLNIPYLMTNTCEALPQNKITHTLNLNNYIKPHDTESTMLKYLTDKGYDITPCYHFKQDGHQAWADKLHGHLKDLNYVE